MMVLQSIAITIRQLLSLIHFVEDLAEYWTNSAGFGAPTILVQTVCFRSNSSIPLEHSAYARLSRPFLDFFVGGSEYETTTVLIVPTNLAATLK